MLKHSFIGEKYGQTLSIKWYLIIVDKNIRIIYRHFLRLWELKP